MIFYPRSHRRPYHFGPHPMEALARDASVAAAEARRPRRIAADKAAGEGPLAAAALKYRDILAGLLDGAVAPATAPVPDDRERRAADIKGAGYFMDASIVGVCRLAANGWVDGADRLDHAFAVVLMIEGGRVPEPDNLAHGWVQPAVAAAAEMRAAEIAVCLGFHIRKMGFSARAHVPGDTLVDLDRLAVVSGVAARAGEALVNPFIEGAIAIAAVSTDYALATDQPLDPNKLALPKLRTWWGINGALSGRERNRRRRRATHLSRYPMEIVRRVERPTTLIIDDEVPRVPKRAGFFTRAGHGDLGEKSRVERARFATKTPLSFGIMQALRALVPHQDGPVAENPDLSRFGDPEANARAIKSLSYFLGSDLTGICRVPDYAWYSHGNDGAAIVPYHRTAVVMLLDQGYDTMEGSSGDDWISGSQSMRAYLRGTEIAGVMSEVIRALGFPARSHTNADSDVLQIPLILLAGLGELSRIGELVLNPFVGPRFKSVVLTTDMPLAVDQPIDFGLQDYCSGCMKCARECPCDAIPFGPKIMFNGYETWKPDVERCARYRLTNAKGSACGRCMKMCPLNKVIDADGALLHRLSMWLEVKAPRASKTMVPAAQWLDDALGYGRRNLAKKWWFDHEIVGAVTVAPRGANARELDRKRRTDPARQKMAFYHADAMPPPDEAGPVPVDRKRAMEAAKVIEMPEAARRRLRVGGPTPKHYRPTAPVGHGLAADPIETNPYKP